MKVKGVMRTWLPWQYHLSKEVNSLKIHFTDKSAWKQGENMNFPTKKKEFLIFSSSYLFTTLFGIPVVKLFTKCRAPSRYRQRYYGPITC